MHGSADSSRRISAMSCSLVDGTYHGLSVGLSDTLIRLSQAGLRLGSSPRDHPEMCTKNCDSRSALSRHLAEVSTQKGEIRLPPHLGSGA